MLRVEGATVRFGGLQALDSVSLAANSGAITGLIGPNGAGKTTLFNVISGLQSPNCGRVILGDRDITRVGPEGRSRCGLARTFQRLELFGSLSVRDNIMVALDARRPRLSRKERMHECKALLDMVGLSGADGLLADVLPTGTARLLEIARALASAPQVLLLDEVSSGLDDGAVSRLSELLARLAASDMALLLVEHDVELVMRMCSSIYVLDFGKVIAHGSPVEIQENEAVQAAYLGGTT